MSSQTLEFDAAEHSEEAFSLIRLEDALKEAESRARYAGWKCKQPKYNELAEFLHKNRLSISAKRRIIMKGPSRR